MSKRQTSEHARPEGRTGAKDARPSRRPALWAGAFWLAIWQLAAVALGSELLLPGPATVLARLVEMVPQPAFWARVGFSLVRIAGGFALGAACGAVGAFAAARWRIVEELLAPLMALAKSVPVASITVLALIWLRAANLAVLVVLLVVLPIVYENVLQGLRATDGKLEEAARLYHVPPVRRLRFLVMPTLFPYLSTALALGLSTAWKAGVAAEVIGIPAGSLGEAIYDAKVYFDTPALFAVTLAVVLASAACTAALRGMLAWIEPLTCGRAGRAGRIERATTAESPVGNVPATGAPAAQNAEHRLCIERLSKAFGDAPVLNGVTFTVRTGEPICLMAPSGSGKTTLLRIIAGLETANDGSVAFGDPCDREPLPRVAMSFQDDRLADQASALANARIGLPAESPAWAEAPGLLQALGIGERQLAPAGTCSGGERRRIGLARALLAPHEILLLDEPFNGLDAATREHVATIIRERERGRIVVMASHDERDAELIGARIVHVGLR